MNVPAQTRGVVLGAAGIGVISFDSLLIRLQDMPPANVALWRGVFTATGFVVLSLLSYRGQIRTVLTTIDAGLVGVAVFTALGNTLFVVAITHTGVADTLVILASAPLMTALMGWVLLRERPPLRT